LNSYQQHQLHNQDTLSTKALRKNENSLRIQPPSIYSSQPSNPHGTLTSTTPTSNHPPKEFWVSNHKNMYNGTHESGTVGAPIRPSYYSKEVEFPSLLFCRAAGLGHLASEHDIRRHLPLNRLSKISILWMQHRVYLGAYDHERTVVRSRFPGAHMDFIKKAKMQ
jgi:hypothetical protein